MQLEDNLSFTKRPLPSVLKLIIALTLLLELLLVLTGGGGILISKKSEADISKLNSEVVMASVGIQDLTMELTNSYEAVGALAKPNGNQDADESPQDKIQQSAKTIRGLFETQSHLVAGKVYSEYFEDTFKQWDKLQNKLVKIAESHQHQNPKILSGTQDEIMGQIKRLGMISYYIQADTTDILKNQATFTRNAIFTLIATLFFGVILGLIFSTIITRKIRSLINLIVRSRENLDLVLDSVDEGVIGVGLDGSINYVNRAAEDLLSYKGEELLGKSEHSVLHHSNADGSPLAWGDCAVKLSMEHGTANAVRNEVFWKKNRHHIPVEYRVNSMHSGAQILGAVVTFRDITLQRIFRKMHSEEIVSTLLKNNPSTLLGDNTHVSVLFCDIRSFTRYSEELGAEAVIRMLNEFLEIMVSVIQQNKGVVDKFIGDGIMALWGLPKPKPEIDAQNAVKTCLMIRAKLAELNIKRVQRGEREIHVAMGLSSGDAVIGAIGSSSRMDFTVIGDTVNTASRMETMAKTLGHDLIISAATAGLLEDKFELEGPIEVAVSGKTNKMTVYICKGYAKLF